MDTFIFIIGSIIYGIIAAFIAYVCISLYYVNKRLKSIDRKTQEPKPRPVRFMGTSVGLREPPSYMVEEATDSPEEYESEDCEPEERERPSYNVGACY